MPFAPVKFILELPPGPCHLSGMPRNKSYGFETPRFSYAQVERALAAVMSADATAQAGPMRGRLKRISTLGLPEARPGKGQRRRYSLGETCQLALVLLIEDAGLDPTVAVAAIKRVWPRIERNVPRALDSPPENPTMLTLRLATISGPFRDGDPRSALPWITVASRYDERARARHQKHGFRVEDDNVAMLVERDDPDHWVCFRNLTAALSKLQEALGD
jgi:hypothetical protein